MSHSKRVIVIGDVHGCLVELQELVARLQVNDDDRVIFLGDLLDKGPYPFETLRYMRFGLGPETGAEVDCVASNHEHHHARKWRRREAQRLHGTEDNTKPWHDPQEETVNRLLREDDVSWIEARPPWLEVVPGWVAVHAGFDPRVKLAEQDPDKVRNMRWIDRVTGSRVPVDYDDPARKAGPPTPDATHWTDLWRGPESVVYGHEAFSLSRPRFTCLQETDRPVRTLGIDTGCVHGGHLTAAVFASDSDFVTPVQVKAKQVYLPNPLIPE
jgi:hypothetical protein